MASNEGKTPDEATQQPAQPRRASFAELFASRPSNDGNRPQPSAMSAALTQQAQDQTRARRVSITTLGLSGTSAHAQQTSPFSALRGRGKSFADAVPESAIDRNESAIDETDTMPPTGQDSSVSPPTRKLSFGARAYSNAKSVGIAFAPTGNPGGGGTTPPKASSPQGIKGKEGFNWTENFRTRAARASISAASGSSGGAAPLTHSHSRSKSQTSSDAAPFPQMPSPKPAQKVPDQFQERILKGDFYMD